MQRLRRKHRRSRSGGLCYHQTIPERAQECLCPVDLKRDEGCGGDQREVLRPHLSHQEPGSLDDEEPGLTERGYRELVDPLAGQVGYGSGQRMHDLVLGRERQRLRRKHRRSRSGLGRERQGSIQLRSADAAPGRRRRRVPSPTAIRSAALTCRKTAIHAITPDAGQRCEGVPCLSYDFLRLPISRPWRIGDPSTQRNAAAASGSIRSSQRAYICADGCRPSEATRAAFVATSREMGVMSA